MIEKLPLFDLHARRFHAKLVTVKITNKRCQQHVLDTAQSFCVKSTITSSPIKNFKKKKNPIDTVKFRTALRNILNVNKNSANGNFTRFAHVKTML